MFNRIQKLLSNEYRNFYEEVLVESPFAQLSSRRKGIRAVQIALTKRNLIIATDKFLHEGKLSSAKFEGLDPDIETLELVHVIPLKLILLKLSRKGIHDQFFLKIIKKSFPNRCWRVYEFGGHFLKHFFWAVWNSKLVEMREEEELFNNSSLENFKVRKMFESSSFNEDQSVTHKLLTQELPLAGRLTSNSSLKGSLKNSMMDEITQFPSGHRSNCSKKAFKETAL